MIISYNGKQYEIPYLFQLPLLILGTLIALPILIVLILIDQAS